jgi:hypothetical protein
VVTKVLTEARTVFQEQPPAAPQLPTSDALIQETKKRLAETAAEQPSTGQ